jgi:hypothetical protein
MGLGPTHTVYPDEAREKARQYRRMQLDGIDPLAEKRERLADAKLDAARAKTFREVADAWLDDKAKLWKPSTFRLNRHN